MYNLIMTAKADEWNGMLYEEEFHMTIKAFSAPGTSEVGRTAVVSELTQRCDTKKS